MTENKRFVYYEHKGADYILENPNEDLDFIEMLGDCLDSEEIVNRLNELYDENAISPRTDMVKSTFLLRKRVVASRTPLVFAVWVTNS